MTIKPDWVAVDWGTTHLRVWLMMADGTVLERRDDPRGMAALTPAQFDEVLTDVLGQQVRRGLPVIVCGMAGAAQGWRPAPYHSTPTVPPKATEAVKPEGTILDVYILPGVSQTAPADVMRGEETQIAGFLSLLPDFDGVLCMPGTHTKWVHISAGEIVSFRTFMTGEMFALLGAQSVLRHSVGAEGWDDAAFDDAVSDLLSRPNDLAAKLFSLRAADVLHGVAGAKSRAQLSGYLIGAELAAAKPYWLGQRVAIVGDGDFETAYLRALTAQGVQANTTDAQTITLAGLKAAYATLIEA